VFTLAAVLLSRTYVFATFGGRWADVAFLAKWQLGTRPYCPGRDWKIATQKGQAQVSVLADFGKIGIEITYFNRSVHA